MADFAPTDINPLRSTDAPSPLSLDGVLAALRDLPVYTWRYDEEEGSPLHLGPMAQDFHAAFGLGGSDKVITTVDGLGVLLTAVKALSQRVTELEERVSQQG